MRKRRPLLSSRLRVFSHVELFSCKALHLEKVTDCIVKSEVKIARAKQMAVNSRRQVTRQTGTLPGSTPGAARGFAVWTVCPGTCTGLFGYSTASGPVAVEMLPSGSTSSFVGFVSLTTQWYKFEVLCVGWGMLSTTCPWL